MTIEATLERIESKLDQLLSIKDKPELVIQAPAATPKPRGRGKAAVEAPAAAPDPFETASPSPAAAPVATLDEVRAALTALKDATTQATAIGVLKATGGADNLSSLAPAKYDAVVAAAKAAMPAPQAEEADPFETGPTSPAVEEKPVSLEDVKAAVVAAQQRTAVSTVQKIVMDHGGKAAGPNGVGPSLKSLPVTEYAKVIAAVNALPTTK